ncbi:MAG: hypothetical protein ACSHYA_14550 [Opitutaceae bacterium]
MKTQIILTAILSLSALSLQARPEKPEGGDCEKPTAADFIARLDADEDGYVSEAEFDGPSEHFEHMDQNSDGFISEDEAPSGPPPRKRGGKERE